jgi:hypothetical protein
VGPLLGVGVGRLGKRCTCGGVIRAAEQAQPVTPRHPTRQPLQLDSPCRAPTTRETTSRRRMATSRSPFLTPLTCSSSSLNETARKATKSKNTKGSPIKLPSKILAVIPDPQDDNHIYVAAAAGFVKRINIEVGQTSCTSASESVADRSFRLLRQRQPIPAPPHPSRVSPSPPTPTRCSPAAGTSPYGLGPAPRGSLAGGIKDIVTLSKKSLCAHCRTRSY